MTFNDSNLPDPVPKQVILSFAVTMCGSFTAYKAITSPDNRMAPSKRTALLRFWQ